MILHAERSSRRAADHAPRLAALALVFAAALASPSASADDPPPPAPAPLRYDLRADLPSLAGGAAELTVTLALQSKLAPATCRWCDRPLDDLDLTFKRALRWNDTHAADAAGTAFAVAGGITAAGLETWLSFASGGRAKDWGVDMMVIGESWALAMNLDEIVKLAAGRQRPLVHDPGPSDKGAAKIPEDNMSFFSGHTTSSFALAVSAGTVASLRGYKAAPAVWATGLLLAGTTGYLRIAADKHYFTDVLMGAAVGAASGFVVPYLHRPLGAGDRARVTGVSPLAVRDGGGIGVTGRF
jgi:PAP2 superfamily